MSAIINIVIFSTLSSANAMDPLNPKVEPTTHVSLNPNLYVSAENSLFKNYFAGPQIIEVIVIDPDINRLDQAYGEPVVTINDKRLRMAQATDGGWHAYFADINQAKYADATQLSNSGKGLDFGQFCSSNSARTISTGLSFSPTNDEKDVSLIDFPLAKNNTDQAATAATIR